MLAMDVNPTGHRSKARTRGTPSLSACLGGRNVLRIGRGTRHSGHQGRDLDPGLEPSRGRPGDQPMEPVDAVEGPRDVHNPRVLLPLERRGREHHRREGRFTGQREAFGELLRRLAGPEVAFAMDLFGEILDGRAAERVGLVWRCVPDDSPIPQIGARARRPALRRPSLRGGDHRTTRALAPSQSYRFVNKPCTQYSSLSLGAFVISFKTNYPLETAKNQ